MQNCEFNLIKTDAYAFKNICLFSPAFTSPVGGIMALYNMKITICVEASLLKK